jgi:hypothetical protein
MLIRISLSAFLGMALFGCAYRSPEIEIPCEWHTPISEELETSSMNHFIWWEELNDPQLNASA